MASTDEDLKLATWRIRPDQIGKVGQVDTDSEGYVVDSDDKNPICNYESLWGAMSMKSQSLLHLATDSETVGDLISCLLDSGIKVATEEMSGSYYDCGTAKEYMELIRALSGGGPEQK